MLPKPELEQKSLALLKEIDRRVRAVGCSVRTSAGERPDRRQDARPYDYVTPNYWYEDTTRGGATASTPRPARPAAPPPTACAG